MKLKVTLGKSLGNSIHLHGSGPFSIGRHSRNDLRINDDEVSRWHAAITNDNGKWFITDLQSKNGVKVNGECINDPKEIKSNDQIRLGYTLIAQHPVKNWIKPVKLTQMKQMRKQPFNTEPQK